MVVTVRTILVTLFVRRHVLPKRLSTLFAHEHHLSRLREPVRLRLGVALGAVEPLLATRRTNRHLRVQDVFAGETERRASGEYTLQENEDGYWKRI